MFHYDTIRPVCSVQIGNRLCHFDGLNTNWVDDGMGLGIRRLGIVGPTTSPTSAEGAAGSVDAGVHLIYVTFAYIRFGVVFLESPPCAAVSHTSAGSKKIDLSSIPVSSNPFVNARIIYMTRADGNEPLRLTLAGTINDNTTTTYSIDTADSALTAIPLAENNTPLPCAPYARNYGNRLVVGGAVPKPLVIAFTNASAAFTVLPSEGGSLCEGDIGKSVIFPSNTAYLIATVNEGAQTGTLTTAYQGATSPVDGEAVVIMGDPNLVTISNPLPLSVEGYDAAQDTQIYIGQDDGMNLRAIAPYRQTLLFGKSKAIYQLTGDLVTDTTSGPSYRVDILTDKAGMASHWSAQPFMGGATIFYGGDGIYIYDGVVRKVSQALDALFDDSRETSLLLGGVEDFRVDHSEDEKAHAIFDHTTQRYFLWLARKQRPTFRAAVLTPTISGGKITDVTITDPGEGYIFAPNITVTQPVGGMGGGAAISCTVSGGMVDSVTVTSQGLSYASDGTVTLTVNGGGCAPYKPLDMCVMLDFKHRNSLNRPAAWVFLIPASKSLLWHNEATFRFRPVIGNYHGQILELLVGHRDGVPEVSTGTTNYQFRVASVTSATSSLGTLLTMDTTGDYGGYIDPSAGTPGLPIVGVSGDRKGRFSVLRSYQGSHVVEVDDRLYGPCPFQAGDLVTIGGYHAFFASNRETGGMESVIMRGSRLKTMAYIPTFTDQDT